MSKDTEKRVFKEAHIERISKILGDTNSGLTGSEIARFLASSGIKDTDPTMTKWKRLYNAFITSHNEHRCGNKILGFIAKALAPERFTGNTDFYFGIIDELNSILIFIGLEFQDDGKFHKIKPAESLSEAEKRAKNLSDKVKDRGMHEELLKYCRAELLEKNYFHAVLEASKGVFETIRIKSGIDKDGHDLIDIAFSSDYPILKINPFNSEMHKAEQRGFVNLLKGLYSTFRTPHAHAPKIYWEMDEQDALDFFSLASYLFRRINNSIK